MFFKEFLISQPSTFSYFAPKIANGRLGYSWMLLKVGEATSEETTLERADI